MRNTMWKGELEGRIDLDTLTGIKGFYGLGPESFLKGELLMLDGKNYVSKVTSDSTLSVVEQDDVSAPFYVYTRIDEWIGEELPPSIKSMDDLERYLDRQTREKKRPFAFKLTGEVEKALIHSQNLPEGTAVASPEDAHQGQIDFTLQNEEVEILGFFSTEHQGIFTHHDSYLHMHLITADRKAMGHLDDLKIKKMTWYLPK